MQGKLLSQRLDRLRTSAANAGRTAAVRTDHALQLASAIGGRSSGGVVLIESSVVLPVDRQALSSLPYGVPIDRPLVCLDLETTGLATGAGTLAFLVGLGWWEGQRLVVRQLLLPDHANEARLLELITASIPSDAWLVTYNGRCFDWPLVVTRFRMHGRDAPPVAGHVDLLPIARQLWKHRTGSARLAVIEEQICDVRRREDLPGALIPERYFGYLRSRRPDLLHAPAEHNRLDIVSLGRLVARLAELAAPSTWARVPPGDLLGLARTMARRGRLEDALHCLDAALCAERWAVRGPAGAAQHRELSSERARLLARAGRRAEAVAAWLEIARRGGPGAATAWLHVARHREHFQRDFEGALDAAHEAAAVAGRARAWGVPLHAVERDLARRLPRLSRRAFASGRLRSEVSRAA